MKAATPITINSINEYSFYEFVSTVVSEDYSGEITGTKTVLETVEAESLNITSLWNYFPFPNAFVHKTQKRVVISGRKNFTYVTADTVWSQIPDQNGIRKTKTIKYKYFVDLGNCRR